MQNTLYQITQPLIHIHIIKNKKCCLQCLIDINLLVAFTVYIFVANNTVKKCPADRNPYYCSEPMPV